MRLEDAFLNSLLSEDRTDGGLRIDIYGVAPEEEPAVQAAPPPPARELPEQMPQFVGDDFTAMATEMAGGTEPPGATPMTLKEFATSAADVPAGLLKGAVQASAGLPGDIISLMRGLYDLGASGGDFNAFLSGLEKATGMPTTEDVKKFFDKTLGMPLVPAGASERRRQAAKTPEFVGELFGGGVAVTEGVKGGVKMAREIGQEITSTAPVGAIKFQSKELKSLKNLIEEPFKVEPSVATLSNSFDDAINYVRSLNVQEQANIAAMADDRLASYIGRNSKGKANKLLTSNGKLQKTEKGGKGKEPIKLPDGRGVENAGLALSPAFKVGKFSTCPNSASCKEECLGKTANGYYIFGGGADLDALGPSRERGFRMTQAMFREPEAFAIKLHNEITSLKLKAAKNGNMLAIRLNVLSDINPRIHKSLIEAHPDVAFYDYTKNNTNPIAPNHHYTYSSTGVTQPAGFNGLKVDVQNENTNWRSMRRRLDQGGNVAMAFSHKRVLPETVFDEESGKVYRVVDGDAYDFRPMDKQPAGTDGVIIGLKNKAITRKESSAAEQSKGFFVQYDPQILRAGGKQVRDEFGVPVAGNKQVRIANQRREQITLTNDGQQQSIETGASITEQVRQ